MKNTISCDFMQVYLNYYVINFMLASGWLFSQCLRWAENWPHVLGFERNTLSSTLRAFEEGRSDLVFQACCLVSLPGQLHFLLFFAFLS